MNNTVFSPPTAIYNILNSQLFFILVFPFAEFPNFYCLLKVIETKGWFSYCSIIV